MVVVSYIQDRSLDAVLAKPKPVCILTIFLLATLTSACGNKSTPNKVVQPYQSTSQPRGNRDEIYTIGLTPMLSTSDLVNSLEYGRDDPFAPVQSTNSFGLSKDAIARIKQLVSSQLDANSDYLISQYGSLASLEGFDYSGFIATGKRSKAIVSYQGNLGEVGVGRNSEPQQSSYLPPEWRVSHLDPITGALTLQNKSLRVVFYPGYTKDQIAQINATLGTLLGSQSQQNVIQ